MVMTDKRLLLILFLLLCIAVFAAPTPLRRTQSQNTPAPTFENSVQPVLAANCYTCHNAQLNTANLNLEDYKTKDSVLKDRARWETILAKLQAGEMPPQGLPRPTDAELKGVETWIQQALGIVDANKPSPGRVTAHRLNRAEYNNTVHDLLGVDFKPANDFPQDDSGYGFDNIGDALSLSPVLMEKYLAAAETATHVAIFGQEKIKPTVVRHQPPYREGNDGGSGARFANVIKYTFTNYDETGLTMGSSLHAMHTFPVEGDYEFRISPEGNRPRPSDPFPVVIWIDGKVIGKVDFESTTNGTGLEGLDRTVRLHAPAGEHWVAVSALRLFEGLPAKFGAANPTKQPEPPPAPVASGASGRGRGPALAPLPPDATPEQKAEFEKQQEARAAAVAVFAGRGNKPPAVTDVSFRVNFLEISGPFNPKTAPSPESLEKVFICKEKTAACARTIVSTMARRAWRRPVTPVEVNRLLTLVSNDRARGASFDQSIAVGIEAMMISPNFLFRIERDPAPGPGGDVNHKISQFELASRLSYFLWSSMPDEELLRPAEQGTLRTPAVLKAQVSRMMKDPKAKALVENFGGQWLQFRALESVKPDPDAFRAFNDYLRISMRQETEMFFSNLLSADGSVLDFLDGKYSFLNEELAQYYGVPGVKGPEFRKVDMTGSHRSGILTQGSVLTATSYANRTSVVLRGKWVLENLLNAPVPPPPPNVPAIDEAAIGASMSLRQQMEKHRNNPICASCHGRMDPIGFGLENFDAIGRWRTDDGKFPIESSGTLPDGKSFNGPDELKGILMANKNAFAECITEKMLTYALGRGLEPYDKATVKEIAGQMAKNNYKISGLVLGIVESIPFQQRKGDRSGL
jgi:hypothetical protein